MTMRGARRAASLAAVVAAIAPLVAPVSIRTTSSAVMLQAGPAAEGATTPAVRQAAIDAVWNTVNDRYYRADLNGVDWKLGRAQQMATASPRCQQR